MIRKGKRVLLPLVLLMSASTAIGLAACGENGGGGQTEPEKYTVTYERGADEATGNIPASVLRGGGILQAACGGYVQPRGLHV